MQTKRLQPGDTIGIFCPSHVPQMARYHRIASVIERLGYKVKFGANMEKTTYGYAAGAEERAADLNNFVSDDAVKMVFFSGGASAVEILPYIDYESIFCCNPKIFSSYSDGTSILNAIHAQTGLITYYGSSPSIFEDLRHYDYMQFCSHFVQGYEAKQFVSDSNWTTLNVGNCQGTLVGGHPALFAPMLANKKFEYDATKKYILFCEDHEKISSPGEVATWLAFIGQSEFMNNVVGLIFGHYSTNVPDDLLHCLERFGAIYNIPVVYTDDFGHGTKHAILPIGLNAALDADSQTLIF